MKNALKGERTLSIFFKTALFITLLLTAILVEIVLLPILLIIWLANKKNSIVFRMASRIIIGNGLYLLFILDLKDFRKKLKQIKKRGSPRIYVLNHSSIFDIILIFLMPDCPKILVKESYTKIPILGSIIKLNGHIVVKNNQNQESGEDFYENIVKQLKSGDTIVIFPEGTRSKDGTISRFKNGAFKIAYDTQADIIPIVVDCWNIVRPKDGIWFRENRLHFKILDTLDYDNYKKIEIREFSKNLRDEMANELFSIRDERSLCEKRYYRKNPLFIEIDEKAKNRIKNRN